MSIPLKNQPPLQPSPFIESLGKGLGQFVLWLSRESHRIVTHIHPWTIGLCLVLLLSISLNTIHRDEKLFHPDEGKKVDYVLKGKNDYQHPLLMRQILQLNARAVGAKTPQEVLSLGRLQSAFFGTLSVLILFLIARRMMGPWPALGASTLWAVSPMLTLHGHYLKEDTMLVFWMLTNLWMYLRFIEDPTWKKTGILGLLMGLAFSTHYKGVLLPALFFTAPLLIQNGPCKPSRHLYIKLTAALFFGLLLFSLDNDVFWNTRRFGLGATYEFKHSFKGHKIFIFPWTSGGFLFYLRYGLLPTLGWPLIGLSLFWITLIISHWIESFKSQWAKQNRNVQVEKSFLNKASSFQWTHGLLVLSIISYYVIHECSPTKPFPDYSRYVMVLVPLIALTIPLAIQTICPLLNTLDNWKWLSKALPWVVVVSTLGLFWDSWNILQQIPEDPRFTQIRWVKRALKEREGIHLLSPVNRFEGRNPLRINPWVNIHQGYTFVTLHSFHDNKFQFARSLPGQPSAVYGWGDHLDALYQHPTLEFHPPYRSYGFSAPIVRIVYLGHLRWGFYSPRTLLDTSL